MAKKKHHGASAEQARKVIREYEAGERKSTSGKLTETARSKKAKKAKKGSKR